MFTKEYLLNLKEWKIFFSRGFVLTIIFITTLFFGTIFWFTLGSVAVAPFYSITTTKEITPVKKFDLVGKTTVVAMTDSVQKLLDEGLVTNFIGVRNIIDNKYFEQIGQIDMLRVSYLTLENHMARNRGTGGANNDIRQARAEIHSDYETPWFTSYTTRLEKTIEATNKYLIQLEKDKNVDMNNKKAVFIDNSDNLAETLMKYKHELQTTLSVKVNHFYETDNKFYRLRGNVIQLERNLQGIGIDFKNKMVDKSAYNENFIPLLTLLDKSIAYNPWVVTELTGDLSIMERNCTEISQRLEELIDKLKKG